jgi:hypothetical protein
MTESAEETLGQTVGRYVVGYLVEVFGICNLAEIALDTLKSEIRPLIVNRSRGCLNGRETGEWSDLMPSRP